MNYEDLKAECERLKKECDSLCDSLEAANAVIEKQRMELDFSDDPSGNVVQGLYDKMKASGAPVITASLKDDYSQNGKLQIMLHDDGDIGLVISKGGIPEEEEIQYADITLACGAGGGSHMNLKVIRHLHSIIAEIQE